MCRNLTGHPSVAISWSSPPQVLLQELSGFVLAAKAKLAKSGSASSLSSVIRLCTQSSSRSREVALSQMFSRRSKERCERCCACVCRTASPWSPPGCG